MRTLSLYIDDQKVDLFNDEIVSLNQSIQNVRDISKVFTDFTKTFTIPASTSNNKIFKHYYNFNIIDGFDARTKVSARIELNGIPFKTGKIKLESVGLRNNKAYDYKVTFFGDTVNLKDLLGEDQLDSLPLSQFDYEYSQLYVKVGLNQGITVAGETEALITPLILCEGQRPEDIYQNGVHYDYLKYALRVRLIVEAIETKYGITFSDDFFSSTNSVYEDLYLFLHREKGRVALPEGIFLSTWQDIPFTTDGQFFQANGSGFGIFDINPSAARRYDVTGTINVDVTDEFILYIFYNGSPIQSRTLSGSTTYNVDFDYVTQNGFYEFKVEHATEINVLGTSSWTFIRQSYDPSTPDDYIVVGQGAFLIGNTFIFKMEEQMPKMKVIDFLTGLFKMFNLTAYYDGDEIVVKTLDNYYAAGGIRDWSKYIKADKAEVSPITIFKDIKFRYQGLDNYLAIEHNEAYNKEWATEEYQTENKFDGQTYAVELPFEHLKYYRYVDDNGNIYDIQMGFMLDSKFEPYLGKPLLFYASDVDYSLKVKDTTPVATYYAPSNSRVLNNTSQNLNFKAELNEWTYSANFETLFQNYYSSYISDVFNPQIRIVKYEAVLPVGELINYELNDKIIINSNSYRINSISTNLNTGESQLELLNVV